MIPRWVRLAYWFSQLGPKAGPAVRREEIEWEGRRSLFYLPRSGRPVGAWLISPGAHPQGPDDPRLDRLARILADAGFAVLSPAVPDLMDLRLTRRAIEEVEAAFHQLCRRKELPPGCRPAVLGPCVGSLAALYLAASDRCSRSISAVVTMGAYADPGVLLDALVPPDGVPSRADPLNRPVLFVTLLDHLPGVSHCDRAPLTEAWRDYVRLTWPHAHLKTPGSVAHHPIARAVAARHGLPSEAERVFLMGCGVLPGGHDLCRAALFAPGAPYAYLDPRPILASVAAPVYAVHGRGDVVIPFEQLRVLADGLPEGVRRATYVTGFLRHSDLVGARTLLGMLPALLSEIRTGRSVLRTLAQVGNA